MTALMDIQQKTMDEYPTRKDSTPALLYRRHPVVWGSGEGGPYTADEIASYASTGYVQTEALLSADEVDAYSSELRRLSEDPELRRDERVVVERSSDEVRSVFEVHKVSEVFADLVRDPRVVDRARQVLGGDVYVHQSRVNYKPGFGGGDFWWHSDFETWHAEDGMPAPRAASISIALTDNHAHNGALMVMPGSHKTFVSCVGETPEDHHRSSLKSQEVGVPDKHSLAVLADMYGIDVLTGPAGGATLFDSNVMHGSGGNITPFPRSNIFIVFCSVDNACVEPFAAPKPRPEFLGARDFTPVK